MDEFVIVGDVLEEYKGNDEKVVVPDGIKHIDSCAFARCRMKKVVLPEGLESINDAVFIGCDKLDYIRIPSSTKSIGKRAFFGCSRIKHVFISSDVDIEEQAFESCEMLADENGFIIINNELFECIKGGDLVVPEGVKRIRGHAFSVTKEEVKTIKLPKSLKKIDSNAFALWNKCKLYITAKTTDIADDAFTRIKPVICAPAFSTAHKYAKKRGMAFVSTGRELSEKIRSDISDKIEAKHQKKQSRIHEKRVAEYEMQVEHIDKSHSVLYLKNGLAVPYEMPFFIEDGTSIEFMTEAMGNLVRDFDKGEGKFLCIFAPSASGKTHLLNLIHTSMKNIYPEKRIRFSEAEPFFQEVKACLEKDDAAGLNALCENDVLLLDNCPSPTLSGEKEKKIMEVCADATVHHGGICTYTFLFDENFGIPDIDWLDSICPGKTYCLGFMSTTDEITNYFYAKRFAKKYGYNLDENQLAHISEEASNLAEVREMVAEYKKQE